MSTINRRICLARHPDGAATAEDFAIIEAAACAPAPGEVLVRAKLLSVDPLVRIMIDRSPMSGAIPQMPVGTVIPAAGVGEVIASRDPAFAVGDLVEGNLGWQLESCVRADALTRVDTDVAPPEAWLGPLGLTGFSAYAGLHLAGPLEGRALTISGAAGAVGSLAGQIAAARGGRVVGICSNAEKCEFLKSIRFAAAVDRTASSFAQDLQDALPAGADVYFDNAGGDLFATMVPLMARRGSIVICGVMAQYNGQASSQPGDQLPNVLSQVFARQLTIQAFSNRDFAPLRPAFRSEMANLLATGKVKANYHFSDGLESAIKRFLTMFDAGVTGKLLIRP